MLNIFKSYCAKTSILDDFGFYENRQKAMQEKRNKPGSPSLDNSLVSIYIYFHLRVSLIVLKTLTF